MKILFITHFYLPHIGGVEKHINEVAKRLERKGHIVKIISEADIKYPHIKVFGLIYIWIWFFKNSKLIQDADVVHIHDVFIWYLPFRFICPRKEVFTTLHGWEGIWPIPLKYILYKKVASKLSFGVIAVGKYIEKYYEIEADKITYGAN